VHEEAETADTTVSPNSRNVQIQLSGVAAGYNGVPVVRDLTMDVRAGEVVCLLGANGAGKSTTLLTIAGALPAIRGRVQVMGSAVNAGKPHEIARRGVAIVPADRGHFSSLTVAENLRLRCHRGSTVTIADVLTTFPALKQLLHRPAGLLSGGEQQMLAIAGALVADPKVIMLDEMSLGLAPTIVERLLPVIRSIANERGLAVLLVEQHVRAALSIADRGYILAHGEVVAEGSARQLSQDVSILESSYLGKSP
jgi:branched-chain amino acid transport system ATP-binding protein